MLKKQPGNRSCGFLRHFISSGRRCGDRQAEEVRDALHSFKEKNEQIRFHFRKIILAAL